MTLADELTTSIYGSEYFRKLFLQLENTVANCFWIDDSEVAISMGERRDLLRFADILSHSSSPDARNAAYRIVALLAEIHGIDDELGAFAQAILSKLGNFPGLAYLHRTHAVERVLPLERDLESRSKKRGQATSDGQHVLTDSQFEIRQALEKHDYFSFSGPTSIGKSFIIRDFIRVLASGEKLNQGCVVVLVPTRALIGQMVNDLRNEIPENDVNVAAFPGTSPYLESKYKKTIYVLTPERLLRYIADAPSPVKYLFIDEAQKVTSESDERSSLYYHAIYETTRRFATKLVFASPNIPNPGVFLGLFERDQSGSMAVGDRTVSQNKYFLDLEAREVRYYSNLPPQESSEEVAIAVESLPQDLEEVVEKLGRNASNLIYCNSAGATVDRARIFAERRSEVAMTADLATLLEFIEQYVHVDYYLLMCLKRGVAFHHGRMPQEVRTRVEAMFSDPASSLKYMFCTSTLLEGVNLPAKNIFVLTERHGLGKFSQIDFENLIGRAGRLTREFSGNVICIRAESNRWPDTELLKTSVPAPVVSFLTDVNPRRTREFTNMGKLVADEPTAGNLKVGIKANLANFASIVLLHHLEGLRSPLMARFLEKNKNGLAILKSAAQRDPVPGDALRVSPTIRAKHQHNALAYIQEYGRASQYFPSSKANMDSLPLLTKLYELYEWDTEETKGRNPLIPPGLVKAGWGESRLSYWAMLMDHWIKSEPLNRIIGYSLHYHQERGYIWFSEGGRPIKETFVRSARHTNIVIEQVMSDIENGLRYRIVRYLQNYYDLSKQKLAGEDLGPNWAELVEYGTLDKRSVSLQNTGFSRTAAEHLLATHLECLTFDAQSGLERIDIELLITRMSSDHDLTAEILDVLRKDHPDGNTVSNLEQKS